MAGAAVFPLVKGIHIEIFIFLGVEGLHFKQATVTNTAGVVLFYMILMPEDDGFDRFGVKDARGSRIRCKTTGRVQTN